jgi:nucleotide sugar dehydrogenase
MKRAGREGNGRIMSAVVIGYGNVGKATARVLGIKDWIDLSGSVLEASLAAEKDWAFICVPTPTVEGHCDLRAVQSAILGLLGFDHCPTFVIRSTVPPNTAKIYARTYGVTILSNPCFSSEKTMYEDELNPRLIVIGGDEEKAAELAVAYQNAIENPFLPPVLLVDNTTAEFIKYAFNSLFATKVVWANEMQRVCQRLEIDYDRVKTALYLHPWVGPNHLDARGRDGQGFYAGGSCLPKDLEAFANYTRSELLHRVMELNREGG